MQTHTFRFTDLLRKPITFLVVWLACYTLLLRGFDWLIGIDLNHLDQVDVVFWGILASPLIGLGLFIATYLLAPQSKWRPIVHLFSWLLGPGMSIVGLNYVVWSILIWYFIDPIGPADYNPSWMG